MDEKILKTIRDYVTTCGGQISLDILEEDFKVSYGTNVPYKNFGYTNIIEFLNSIPGIFVRNFDGEYLVEKHKCKLNVAKPSLELFESDNVTSLCVEMNNNLLLESRNSRRKVTVKPEPLRVIRKKNNQVLRRYTNTTTGLDEEDVYQKYLCPELTADQRKSCCSSSSLCSDENVYANNEDSYYSASPDLIDLTKYSTDMNSLSPQGSMYIDLFTDRGNNLTDLGSEYENDTYNEESILNGWLNDRYEMYSQPKQEISKVEILNRLVNLINLKKNSSTSTEIELRYFANYSEELPKNWLTLLEKSMLIYIENLSAGVIIYPNRSFTENPTMSSLPKMQYPDPKTWNIYVTMVTTTTNMWFRLCDDEYGSKFDILTHEMNKHYDGAETNTVTRVKLGELYAVCMNASVVRVEVIDCHDEMVTCFVIDVGIVRNFKIKCLFVLHNKFMNTCPLALQGSLKGLEKYENCNFVNCKLRRLILNKNATAIVDCFRNERLISLSIIIMSSTYNVNVNRSLLDEIEQDFSLPKFGINQMYDVFVLNVGENTTRIQVISKCYSLLQESLNRAKEIIEADEKCNVYVKSVVDIQLNEMYLTKYTDGSWQRIIVKQFLSSYEVAAMFIDFKELNAVNVRCIVNCSTLPDTLTFIPPQAIDVKFVNDGKIIRDYLKKSDKANMYSIKVIENSEIPVVEMYLKLHNNSNLKPIANLLSMINVDNNVTPMYSIW